MVMTLADAVDPDQVLKSKWKALLDQKKGTAKILTRSTLTHDDTFMKSLPKTRHYLVVALQRQLTRLGFLQSHREQEVFRVWLEQHRSICHLEEQLQAMKLSGTYVTLEDLLKHNGRRTLPKLHISPEETTSQQDHMPASLKGRGGGANACQLHGKQTRGQDDTELMFPEVFLREFKVPKFSALQSTSLEVLSTSMPLLRSDEPTIKPRNIEITRHKLRLMHNLSLSHMAETQRIMAKNGFSLQGIDGFILNELMEYECPHFVQIHKSKCPAESDLTRRSLATTERPESHTENPNIQISICSLPFAEKGAEDLSSSSEAAHSSDTDVPLCIQELCSSLATEAHVSSTEGERVRSGSKRNVLIPARFCGSRQSQVEVREW
ncbi:uncharacterized protein LOC130559251 isoform X4 [Triplophysa rosa]|nr:uncharacterized protein LOC130559251 isoform X4 [Triplophysa rosa]